MSGLPPASAGVDPTYVFGVSSIRKASHQLREGGAWWCGDVLRSLALRLSEMALKAAFKPLTDALGGGLASLFSGGVAFAKGGVLGSPLPVPFAQGGVISSPSPSPTTRRA